MVGSSPAAPRWENVSSQNNVLDGFSSRCKGVAYAVDDMGEPPVYGPLSAHQPLQQDLVRILQQLNEHRLLRIRQIAITCIEELIEEEVDLQHSPPTLPAQTVYLLVLALSHFISNA